MNKFLALLFSLFALTCTTSCAPLMSALPTISTAITDTGLVLQGIQTSVDVFQTIHPLPPAELAQYEQLLSTAYQSLTIAERAVSDLKQIDQAQYDQAFADFKVAFEALAAFLKAKGITPAAPPAGAFAARTAAPPAAFPTPRVIGLRVQ